MIAGFWLASTALLLQCQVTAALRPRKQEQQQGKHQRLGALRRETGKIATTHDEAPQHDWLVCDFNESKDVPDLNELEYAGWRLPLGNVHIPGSVLAGFLGYDPRTTFPERKNVSAANAKEQFLTMLQILNDFSARTKNRYWIIYGQLIGIARTGHLNMWDTDIDFCFESSQDVTSDRIKAAYGITSDVHMADWHDDWLESKLSAWLGSWLAWLLTPTISGISHVIEYRTLAALTGTQVWHGFSLGVANPLWSDYILVYPEGQHFVSDLYIMSLTHGFKAETSGRQFHCDGNANMALPLQVVNVDGVEVSIPHDPVSWLSLVDYPGNADFQRSTNTIQMPLGKFDRCLNCPSGGIDNSGSNVSSSDSLYVFEYDKMNTSSNRSVSFSHRAHVDETKCSAVTQPLDIPVRALYEPINRASDSLVSTSSHSWPELALIAISLSAIALAVTVQLRSGGGDFAKAVCVVPYIMLTTADQLMVRRVTMRHGEIPFKLMCGVVVLEFFKLLVSIAIMAAQGSQASLRQVSFYDIRLLTVPAFMYFCNNVLYYFSVSNSPLAFFGIGYEMQIVFISGLWMVVFGRTLSPARIASCLGVMLGVYVQARGSSQESAFQSISLYVYPIGSALFVSVACIANEYVYKLKADMDINAQNIVTYSAGGVLGLLLIALFQPVHSLTDFFEGMTYSDTVALLAIKVTLGITTSRVLKHADSVTKTMAASVCGPLAIGLAQPVVAEQVFPETVVAVTITYLASFTYWIDPGASSMKLAEVPALKEESKSTLDTCPRQAGYKC